MSAIASAPSPRAGVCMYGRTGFIARARPCKAKPVAGSIYCKPHRDAALRRVPAIKPRGGDAA